MFIDVAYKGPIELFEFPHPLAPPDFPNQTITVNLTFLASHWQCQYGRGCPGLFTEKAKKITPDLGCCQHGFYVHDDAEQKRIEDTIPKLITGEDWDAELWDNYMDHNRQWMLGKGENRRSRIVDGGCIFANRADGSAGQTGKVGCAFLHYGNRVEAQGNDISDNSPEHETYMPTVCWMLPLKMYMNNNGDISITAWSIDHWMQGGGDFNEDGDSSGFTNWWCVDSPDAYTNDKQLVHSMERELKTMIGDDAYAIVSAEIARRGDTIGLMTAEAQRPGAVDPGIRPMLQMANQPPVQTIASQVGKRKPKRPMP